MKLCKKCHSSFDSHIHVACRKRHAAFEKARRHRIKIEDPDRYAGMMRKLYDSNAKRRKDKPEEDRERELKRRREDPAGYLLRQARTRAGNKGLKFTITKSWINERLEIGKCAVTGIPFQTNGLAGGSSHPFQPSIDRINPDGGYEPRNCQLVCAIYNYAKHTYEHSDVVTFARGILK